MILSHVYFVQLPNSASPYLVHLLGKATINRFCINAFFLNSKSGAKCVSCAYKASAGLLYPLERGFIYITKPPIYIHHDDVASCGFNRSNTATGRTFDFEIQLKGGGSQVFSNIEK
jgi:structure-specific recognition protein 1